jgi:hypothetical protein
MINCLENLFHDDFIIVQAQSKEAIMSVLNFVEDKDGIKKKKFCYEIIIEGNRINQTVSTNDVITILMFDYRAEDINLCGFMTLGQPLDDFRIDRYVYEKFGNPSIHVADAIRQVFVKVCEISYGFKLPAMYFESNLYHSMMKKLLIEYYEYSYYNEIDYLNDSLMDKYARLIKDMILLNKLNHLLDISIDTAVKMFSQE